MFLFLFFFIFLFISKKRRITHFHKKLTKKIDRTQAEKRRKQIALLHPPKDGDEEITEEKTTTTSKSSSLAHSDLSLEENQEKKKQVQDFLNKMRESLRKESGSSGPVNAADHGEEKWRYG